ncbi:tetratricopeptide repeat protein [Desulfosediminicola flagellatus]|uniref:tetratricopeptide repeat protein n=1 Tax=Desulfosediminicola flagellatus TaxID=2569541 RepID=UPI0010ABEF7E|nr:tetratricopeptide repeat protein [Desulfosediminicola flagellatus]
MSSLTPINPDTINEMFTTACNAQMEGRLQEAQKLYSELLTFIDAPLLHYNLGLVYYDLSDYENALPHFETSVKCNPEDIDSLFNLALCYKKCSRISDSITFYKKVLVLETNNFDALYNLAGCYRELRQDQSAIETYLKVLEIHQDHISATNNLAYMFQITGQPDQAIRYYKNVLSLDPGHEAATHMLASLEGVTPQSSPDSYVRGVFDNYSDHYEKSLIDELHYSVPTKLRTLFNSIFPEDYIVSSGLDLGCGTGLSGEAFGNIVKSLDGIDLSEKMLDIAREKDIYTSIFSGNIVDYLRSTKIKYDFFVATDVFNYVGNLKEVFSLAQSTASKNAVFCFSTETITGDSFKLQPSGRFAHSPGYIVEVVKKAGWNVELQKQTGLRMEKGKWIPGVLWILKN